MLRVLATTLVATLLTAAPTALTPAPASAAASSDLLPTLADDGRDDQARARVWSPDKRLGTECHRQKYRYTVQVPSNDWVLELVFVDPDGDKIASGYQVAGGDPARGTDYFDVCSPDLRPGRYVIRTTLRWYDADEHVRRLAPRPVRLR